MNHYPINLINLEGKRAMVVGGGPVGARKVAGLLAAQISVRVISPAFTPELEHLAQTDQIEVIRRRYQSGDLAGAFMVVAATDNPEVNTLVWQEAHQRGCLINVVDNPARCNFIVPAVVRRGQVTVAVSTGGAGPVLARRLREQLETVVGPEYGELAALLAELRPEIKTRFPSDETRLKLAYRLIDSGLLAIIRREGLAAARAAAREILKDTHNQDRA
jgi:siroheme synthase-like protein